MKITNKELLTVLTDGSQIGFLPSLIELSNLRTGAKLAFNIAFTLQQATVAQSIVDLVKNNLNKSFENNKEYVIEEWTTLMNNESEFEIKTINLNDLINILDNDKITPSLLFNLKNYITE